MKFSATEIKQFKTVEKEGDFESSALIWEAPDYVRFKGPVHVKAEAKLVDTDTLINGRVSAPIQMTCVRCLNDFETTHQADFQQIYSFQGEIIDISSEIRESFLIDLPLHPICNPNCQGVLPGKANQDKPSVLYSDELKSDPRWDKLKKIN